MGFLPILQALSGAAQPTVRIELKVQGCCGAIACCSPHSQQTNHQKMVFSSPYRRNKEETGVLSPEKQSFIKNWLCCCCSAHRAQKDNIRAKKELVHYLSTTYGDLATKVAIGMFFENSDKTWNDPDEQKKPLTVTIATKLIRETERVSAQIRSSDSYRQLMEARDNQTEFRFPSKIPRIEAYTPERNYPLRVRSAQEAANSVLKEVGIRILYRDPAHPRSPWREHPAADAEPPLEQVIIETQDEPASEDQGSSIIKVSSLQNSPHNSPQRIPQEITVRVPKTLKETVLHSPQELNQKECIEFYQALLRNDISVIQPMPEEKSSPGVTLQEFYQTVVRIDLNVDVSDGSHTNHMSFENRSGSHFDECTETKFDT